MPHDNLKEFWKIIAHQINNATANISLEASTLQLLLGKKNPPREQIINILKSMDQSVDVVTAALREMDELWNKLEKNPVLDIAAWEKDFRRRLNQLK